MPLTTTLLLIRHGHASDSDDGMRARLCGWYDPPLSSRGRAQVARLGAWAARESCRPTALYTSHLRRARATADGLVMALGLRPRVRRALAEIQCGTVDGWPLEAVARRYPRVWQANLAREDDTFAWPGGESYRAFRSRALRACHRLAAAHPGGRVVVVTHAGVLNQIVASLEGVPPARWDYFRPDNASITILRWSAGEFTPLQLDERAHLGPDSVPPERIGSANDTEMVAGRSPRIDALAGGGSVETEAAGQVVSQRTS